MENEAFKKVTDLLKREKGVTLRQLAELLGENETTIYNIRRGSMSVPKSIEDYLYSKYPDIVEKIIEKEGTVTGKHYLEELVKTQRELIDILRKRIAELERKNNTS